MCSASFERKVAVKRFRATLHCVFCILSSHRLQPESFVPTSNFDEELHDGGSVQGYLAHKKTPPP